MKIRRRSSLNLVNDTFCAEMILMSLKFFNFFLAECSVLGNFRSLSRWTVYIYIYYISSNRSRSINLVVELCLLKPVRKQPTSVDSIERVRS